LIESVTVNLFTYDIIRLVGLDDELLKRGLTFDNIYFDIDEFYYLEPRFVDELLHLDVPTVKIGGPWCANFVRQSLGLSSDVFVYLQFYLGDGDFEVIGLNGIELDQPRLFTAFNLDKFNLLFSRGD